MSTDELRRRLLQLLGAVGVGVMGAGTTAPPARPSPGPSSRATLGDLRVVRAGILNIAYHETGPSDGQVVILLHGFPYDVSSYLTVAPALAAQGARVITPHLRGHGPTRFLSAAAPRSGEQAALGQDLIDLMDALGVRQAILAGYDWGGRAACVVAALWPERCAGLVSVNGYLIQNIATSNRPAPAAVEHGFWYQFYFQTERGRAGLEAHRRDIARILWTNNSPSWRFSEAEFLRSAAAFDNPDYVDVVIHSYRHRLGGAPGLPEYADLQARLAAQPTIAAPTITLDGQADGVVAATDGAAQAARFTGRRQHRILPGVGHNPPQEAPEPFIQAVLDCAQMAGERAV